MWTKRTPLIFHAALLAISLTLVAGCAARAEPFRPRSASLYDFRDGSAALGVSRDESRTWGATWNDFDSDGDPDLMAGRHWREPLFYVNRGRRFQKLQRDDVFERVTDRHGCAWGEANGDGLPDLYCVQGADKGTGSGPNQMYVLRAGRFVEEGEGLGVADALGRGRTANWLDFDGDMDLDLFVGNHLRPGHPNVTLENTGEGFRRVDIGLSEELSTIGSSWADWDGDSDPDLLLHQLEPNPTVAYMNEGGRFTRVELEGITGLAWKSGAWGDYNGDGWSDLHLVSAHRAVVLRNEGGSFALEHEMALTEGRMSAWLDAENDGDLDLLVVQGAESDDYQPRPGARDNSDFLLVRTRGGFLGPIHQPGSDGPGPNGDAIAVADMNRDGRVDAFVSNGYFHSKGAPTLIENRSRVGHWIGLDLNGTRVNPQGIGASVHVVTPTRTYSRQMTDGVNFRAQSEIGYFHLGISGNRMAFIRVEWPDGTEDCRMALA
ncbi:MAG TPA: VCBS repeat-containing protein, partial [Actinomycetota bacterium]|nr:VCBS repeat-containing protein [Actinomycetota bacterium]